MEGTTRIVCIPPDMLGAMWPHVGPVLLKGQTAADQTLRQALQAMSDGITSMQQGLLQLWAVIDDDAKRVVAALVTQILIDDDGAKVVWVSGLGGEDLARWGKQASDTIAAFAKAEGCAAFRFHGRKASLRVYRNVRIVGQQEPGLYLFERAA